MKLLEDRGLMIAGALAFMFATLSQLGIVLAGLSGGYIYSSTAEHCDSLGLGMKRFTECGLTDPVIEFSRGTIIQ